MNLEDLLRLGPELRDHAAKPEMDPFTEPDALQEAQLLSVAFDAVSRTAGILLELRTALQLREANTGVLVLHGVRHIAWSSPLVSPGLIAWTVGSSTPKQVEDALGLALVMWPHPGAQLDVLASSGAFFVGDVHGLSEAPPDYTGRTRDVISDKVAHWSSDFTPISAVFLDPRSEW